jgi:sialic acid synthase SpsE
MIPFSTPFDATAVEFLESLNVPSYKIASFENTDLPLIRRVAATGKPIIISTGMATVAELDETVRAAREAGCKDLILLKCTSTYPATAEFTNILTIPHLRGLFDCEVGLSDHTMGVGVSVASVALGATVIEKHFTLDQTMSGPDHRASLEPDQLTLMVREIRAITLALGDGIKTPQESEWDTRKAARQQVVVSRDIRIGDSFSRADLSTARSGEGRPPMALWGLVGTVALRDYQSGETV